MDTRPRTATNSRPRMCAEERRAQLLEVARDLFSSIGYKETTTAMIAARAGVSEPILYRHFSSKLALFHDILEGIASEAKTRLQTIASMGTNAAEKLLALVEEFPRISEERRNLFSIVDRALATAKDARTQELLCEYYGGFETLLRRLVEEGHRDGSVREDCEARSVSWMLVMYGVGFSLLSRLSWVCPGAEPHPGEVARLVGAMIRPQSTS